METSTILSILAILSPICSIAFGYFAFSRNKHKDAAEDGQQNGTVLTEIGYIKSESQSESLLLQRMRGSLFSAPSMPQFHESVYFQSRAKAV